MKKNILIIMSSLGGGGAEKVLITYLQNFDYERFDVELVLINKIGVFLEQIPKQVRLTVLYDKPNSLRQRLDYNAYSKLGIAAFERNRIRSRVGIGYDAIISWCEGRSLKFHSYITDRTDNNISWVHTDLFNNHYTVGATFTQKHEKRTYAAMQKLVYVSNNAQKYFEKLFPSLNFVQKYVVLNPIDKQFIASYRREKIINNVSSTKFRIA